MGEVFSGAENQYEKVEKGEMGKRHVVSRGPLVERNWRARKMNTRLTGYDVSADQLHFKEGYLKEGEGTLDLQKEALLEREGKDWKL